MSGRMWTGGVLLGWAQGRAQAVRDVSLADLTSKLTDGRPNEEFGCVEESRGRVATDQ